MAIQNWPDETPEGMKKWLVGYTAKSIVASTTGGRGKPSRFLTVRTVLSEGKPLVGFEVTIGNGHEIFTDMDKALEAYCDGI